MKPRVSDLRREFPATLEAIEAFCVDFQRWRAVACAELDAFSAELLLREALTNSVVHRGEAASSGRISCVLRAKRGRLIIAIRDGGVGFDWRAAWDRKTDSRQTHGRGIEILRHYASTVRFNQIGNSVTLIKRF